MKKKFTFLVALVFWALMTTFSQNTLSIINPDQGGDIGPQGYIEEAQIFFSPQGAYIETELVLTISAVGLFYDEDDLYEIVLNFSLPTGAIVHDSWLWMPDGEIIVKADILDISQASSTYEDIVDRQRDPSILYEKGDNNYQLRVYPLTGEGVRKVKITYLTPAIWSEDKVETWLPIDILQTSAHPLYAVTVMTSPSEIWQNPRLEGLPGNQFDLYEGVPEIGNVLVTTVHNEDFGKPFRFVVDAPFDEDGVFINHLQDGGDNFYQMAYLPPAVDAVADAKNVVFLFDHENDNVQIDKKDLFEKVKQLTVDGFTAADQFNMIFTDPSVGQKMLSEEWVSGDNTSMTNAFFTFSDDPIKDYSDLTGLLEKGIDFVKNNGGEGDIVLFVSSDEANGNVWGDSYLQALLTQIGEEDIHIHVIGYQTLNFYSYGVWTGWNSSTIIYPSHNFFESLTYVTSGSLHSSFTGSANVWERIETGFSSIKGVHQNYDLHTSLENGFTLERFHPNYAGQSVFANTPILQVGKYLGNFPFNIEYNTFVNGGFISETKTINEEAIFQADTLVREIWMGNYLPSLESNTPAAEIAAISIEERVLTPYTAFLALDLENGGEPCWKCWDYDGSSIVFSTENAKTPDLGIEITASPNPFTDKCLLQFELKGGVVYEEVSISIYNAFGKLVADIDASTLTGFGRMEWLWDGTDKSGQQLTSGMYHLIVKTNKGVQAVKLVLVK